MTLEITLQKTKEQALIDSKNTINGTLLAVKMHLEVSLNLILNTIVSNPDGLTIQEVREFYGEEDAQKLDELAVKVTELLGLVNVQS